MFLPSRRMNFPERLGSEDACIIIKPCPTIKSEMVSLRQTGSYKISSDTMKTVMDSNSEFYSVG